MEVLWVNNGHANSCAAVFVVLLATVTAIAITIVAVVIVAVLLDTTGVAHIQNLLDLID